MSAVLYTALLVVFGWQLLWLLVLQAIVGVVMRETANYIEHYGLLRERRPNGSYVRVSPEHSWNSDHIWSNLFLFHLQRHSDHHAHPYRRYQTLRSWAQSPQLPAGYSVMGLVAFCPPLWRRVMHPRVLAYYGNDLSGVNTGVPAETISVAPSVTAADCGRWSPPGPACRRLSS